VTGRTIAYACVQVTNHFIFNARNDPQQVYFALSDMAAWGPLNKRFRLDEFYDDIVSMFEENAKSSWVKETLAWWKE